MNYEKTDSHIHIKFDHSYDILSSGVLNGGICQAEHILNLKVAKTEDKNSPTLESPENTLSKYCISKKWSGNTVGLMTAASMNSLRIQSRSVENVKISSFVTSGLSNPRRAGDKADFNELTNVKIEAGTVNIILVVEAKLSPAALAEALMIATEAKVLAFADQKVLSPISGAIASGTGTDATVIASNPRGPSIKYCGKHTVIGQLIGETCLEAVKDSISWEDKANS